MSEKIKVSELNATTTNNDDDLIMVVQENENNELENFKQTREDFLAGVYEVPSGGIPKTDLASAVQTSLGKADTALQTTDIVSSVDSSSTNSKAVGAKLFYDTIGDIDTALDLINGEVVS